MAFSQLKILITALCVSRIIVANKTTDGDNQYKNRLDIERAMKEKIIMSSLKQEMKYMIFSVSKCLSANGKIPTYDMLRFYLPACIFATNKHCLKQKNLTCHSTEQDISFKLLCGRFMLKANQGGQLSCTWFFRAPKNMALKLNFTKFSLHDNGGRCTLSALSIQLGDNGIINTGCGNQIPFVQYSASNSVNIQYKHYSSAVNTDHFVFTLNVFDKAKDLKTYHKLMGSMWEPDFDKGNEIASCDSTLGQAFIVYVRTYAGNRVVFYRLKTAATDTMGILDGIGPQTILSTIPLDHVNTRFKSKDIFKCSSHVCGLAAVAIHTTKSLFYAKYSYKSEGFTTNKVQSVGYSGHVYNLSELFPFTNRKVFVIQMRITRRIHRSVKMSLANVTFPASGADFCLFGGIAVRLSRMVEKSIDNMPEVVTICSNSERDVDIFISDWSYLVFYSFSSYPGFNGTLKFTLSRCEPLFMWHGNILDSISTYAGVSTVKVNYNFPFVHPQIKYIYGQKALYVLRMECLVIQMFYITSRCTYPQCNIIVYPCNVTFNQFAEDNSICHGEYGSPVSTIKMKYWDYKTDMYQLVYPMSFSDVLKVSDLSYDTQAHSDTFGHFIQTNVHGSFTLIFTENILRGVVIVQMADCEKLAKNPILCGKIIMSHKWLGILKLTLEEINYNNMMQLKSVHDSRIVIHLDVVSDRCPKECAPSLQLKHNVYAAAVTEKRYDNQINRDRMIHVEYTMQLKKILQRKLHLTLFIYNWKNYPYYNYTMYIKQEVNVVTNCSCKLYYDIQKLWYVSSGFLQQYKSSFKTYAMRNKYMVLPYKSYNADKIPDSIFFNDPQSRFISWIEAEKECQKIGRSLPDAGDLTDMKELVKGLVAIRRQDYPGHLACHHLVYVGLYWDKAEQTWKWSDGRQATIPIQYWDLLKLGPYRSQTTYDKLECNSTHSISSPAWMSNASQYDYSCLAFYISPLTLLEPHLFGCNQQEHVRIYCRKHVFRSVAKNDEEPATFQLNCRNHFLQCKDHTCVADIYWQDGYFDCPDFTDEKGTSLMSLDFRCATGIYIPLSLICDINCNCEDCSDESMCFSDRKHVLDKGNILESSVTCLNTTECYTCKTLINNETSVNITLTQVGDLLKDCPYGDDETELQELFKSDFVNKNQSSLCETQSKIPCLSGHSKCFEKKNKCVYDTNRFGHLKFCRNGGHLNNCTEIICKNRFKCPNSYCIPLRKLCDGIVDCPGKYDELDQHCVNYTCPGNLKCRKAPYCVIDIEICDGYLHCPLGDDEDMCALPNCLHGCRCKGRAFECVNLNWDDILISPSTERLHLQLSRNMLTLHSAKLFKLPGLLTLNLSYNIIADITNVFKKQNKLLYLDLSHNNITYLNKKSLIGLNNLLFLWISGNRIQTINHKTFINCINLLSLNLSYLYIHVILEDAFEQLNVTYLDLSHNNIKTLRKTFTKIEEVSEINITHNPIEEINNGLFLGTKNIGRLITDEPFMCCAGMGIVAECSQKISASFCDNIIPHLSVLIIIWIFPTISFLINVLAAFYTLTGTIRTYGLHEKNVFRKETILAVNLYIGNIMFSLYVLFLCIIDIIYKGEFMYLALTWKQSTMCKCLNFMATFSIMFIILALLSLSFNRYINLVKPFLEAKFPKLVKIYIILVWFVSACFAGIVTFANVAGYSNNYCFPLALKVEHGQVEIRQIITIVFVCVDAGVIAAIIYFYSTVIQAITKSTAGLSSSAQERRETRNRILKIKILIIVLLQCYTWILVFLLVIMSLSGVDILLDILICVIIIFITLNSIAHPVIFTVSNKELHKIVCKPC